MISIVDVPSNLLFAIKVGHITCDNASNNLTMMNKLAMWLKNSTGKIYYWRKQKIKFVCSLTCVFQLLMNDSCLAHVINLATQLLISTYSKSPHFDPTHPNAHVPTSCDEVGLVRSIVVKVWIIYLS